MGHDTEHLNEPPFDSKRPWQKEIKIEMKIDHLVNFNILT